MDVVTWLLLLSAASADVDSAPHPLFELAVILALLVIFVAFAKDAAIDYIGVHFHNCIWLDCGKGKRDCHRTVLKNRFRFIRRLSHQNAGTIKSKGRANRNFSCRA